MDQVKQNPSTFHINSKGYKKRKFLPPNSMFLCNKSSTIANYILPKILPLIMYILWLSECDSIQQEVTGEDVETKSISVMKFIYLIVTNLFVPCFAQ